MRSVSLIVVGALVSASVGGLAGCGNEDLVAPPMPTVAGEAMLDLHDDVTASADPTYENVAALLRGDPADGMATGACAYSGCHSGPGKAGLTFRRTSVADPAEVYKMLVEGAVGSGAVAPSLSCEYHPLRRVEPGDPSKSWLYIKLAGETEPDGNLLNLIAAADWDDTMSPCNTAFPFPGSLMPFAKDEPVVPLEPADLRLVAEWILAGAPGPVP